MTVRVLACLLIALALAPASEAQEDRVAAALDAVWVHGVTRELALAELGEEAVPELLRALADADCARRDNAVAFLGHLGGPDAVSALLALLDAPPAAALRPEERRALLLVPGALGWMAERDVPGAGEALLQLSEAGRGDARLRRAAGAAPDPERFLGLLREQTAFGLGLAAGRRPEAARRLQVLAEAAGSESLREAAAAELRLLAAPETGWPRPASAGNEWTGPGPDALRPEIADPDDDVHVHSWAHANHVLTDEPMDDARLDALIARAELFVGRSDFEADPGEHGEDVACCIGFARSGSAQSFGQPNDGLATIDTQGELSEVLDDDAARFKIVELINYCGGRGSNIVGCAWRPGWGIAVVRLSDLSQEARLWTHEYGHNLGLSHNESFDRFLMYPVINGRNDGLDGDGGADVFRDECAVFHSPSLSAFAQRQRIDDACADVDQDDVHDWQDNCPTTPNTDQADSDQDGAGDACECLGEDADGDGVDDCADNCPDTPNGSQGDADGDGTGDLCDGCPLDADKIEPGDCGCGSADADSDGDGALDCDDGCPQDAAKLEPGICGCGQADEDSDGDGALDCEEDCPDDPAKTSPGVCGCGESDGDSDGDGSADCLDACPQDPDKTAPGECGCGQPDADSDGDGSADCSDACPADPDKTEPGTCGCGVPDTNEDGDNTIDCVDNCPDRQNQNQRDRDGDGAGDVCDDCPFDGTKTEFGQCGCGVPDTDSDGDGVADCVDGCPDDPARTEPGACGCGQSAEDSDGDGTLDCDDGCPDDASKTAPGVCGCGVADTDSDGDGTLDCDDGCPNDADKTASGACGCGVADVDTDGDGTLDCDDGCPNDSHKTKPGGCGCDVVDSDSDGDGALDCVDRCPNDPAKTEPGDCGCERPDEDTDGDGVLDCDDNCPLVANPDQADATGDGVGDACACLDRGDVHPDGLGDGVVDLRDFVIAHRKLTGALPIVSHDRDCGDAAPGTTTCEQAGQPRRWCATGDSVFDAEDLAVIRQQVAGVLAQDCGGCATESLGDELRLPADVAPRGETDGVVDVADVLLLLRWVVGFDLPLDAEELLRADIAPAGLEDGLRVVDGEGLLDVGDVLLALRAAVNLDELVWPLRRLGVEVAVEDEHVAVALRSSGWPSWAPAAGFEVAGCDDATGGLELAGSLRGLACVLDAPGSTPGEVAALTYRAPEPIDPAGLEVSVELADEALAQRSPAAQLVQD